MASQQGVRERNVPTKQANGGAGTKANGKSTKTKKDAGFGVMDALRILGGLFLLNCLLSYFITNDSVLWGWRPWFVRPNVLMRYMVSSFYLCIIQCAVLTAVHSKGQSI